VLGFWPFAEGDLAASPVSEIGFHFALRKGRGKTVMPLQNFSSAPALGLLETAGTPQQRQALDQLFSLTYEELRRLASSVKRGDPSNTLSPTALVNEAWMKMAKAPGIAAESPLHFKRIAARAMRQLLIEAARRRNSHKRGGDGEAIFVTFDESLDGGTTGEAELLALDAALNELAQVEPRQAAIVEARFFGGLEVSEVSTLLDVSEATVLRDWRAAKAWLGQALRKQV
jgi:RNA polymerase sigma factor (TIGR02999 family)